MTGAKVRRICEERAYTTTKRPSLEIRCSAIIQVVWCPDNLVPDKGSRFREGGIKDDQDAPIDKTRCMDDRLALSPLTNKQEKQVL